MIRTMTIALTAISLAACSPMDAVEGKPSASKELHDRVSQLEANYAARNTVTPPVSVYTPPAPQPKVCTPIFRVMTCNEDGSENWL